MNSEALPQIPSIANEEFSLSAGGSNVGSHRSILRKMTQQKVCNPLHDVKITIRRESGGQRSPQPMRLLVSFGVVLAVL